MVESTSELKPEWRITSSIFSNQPRDFGAATFLTSVADIHHVTHPKDAQSVISRKRIQTGLIFDESILNSTRIAVVWTSPNVFGQGSLYGTTRFSFDGTQLFEDKHFYWVEAMYYNPLALRILIADRPNDNPNLALFDPSKFDYPLYRAPDGTWYRFNNLNYELMFDSDLLLYDCRKIEVTKHITELCRKGRPCTEPDDSTARRQLFCQALVEPRLIGSRYKLDYAEMHHILVDLYKWLKSSQVKPQSGQSGTLFDLSLLAASQGYFDKSLVGLRTYADIDVLIHSFTQCVRDVFGDEIADEFASIAGR